MKLPPTTSVPPLPSVASVLFVGSDNATAGEIAVPPAEPAVTAVVIALFDDALRLKLFPPVTTVLSCTCASVLLLTIFSATDAPTPTLLPVVALE